MSEIVKNDLFLSVKTCEKPVFLSLETHKHCVTEIL